DTTILIWDLAGLKRGASRIDDLTTQELEARWNDLANTESAQAYKSLTILSRAPHQSVPLMKKHLKPVAAVDGPYIVRLTKDLDSDVFAVREKATKELYELGDLAEPALRQLLASSPSLEAKLRAQAVL